MYRTLNDLIIKGGFFKEEKTLTGLFSRRFNIVFGQNGSGKTSIASAIQEYASGNAAEYPTARMNCDLSDEERRNIFVFNERFVDSNVKFSSDGLETIAMIGKQAQLSDTLDKLQANQKEAEIKKDTYQKLSDSGEKNVAGIRKALTDSLQKDNSYASRIRDIKSLTTKGRVNDEAIGQIIGASAFSSIFPGNENEVREDLLKKIDIIKGSKDGSKISWAPIPVKTELSQVTALMTREVMKPDITDRDRFIINLMNDPNERRWITLTEENILRGKYARQCPLCHQEISPTHHLNLEKKIKDALDKESQTYIAALTSAKACLSDIMFLPPSDMPESVFGGAIAQCRAKVSELNSLLASARASIDRRINDIYSSPTPLENADRIIKTEKELNAIFSTLIDDIRNFNSAIDSQKALVTEALKENLYLSYIENKAVIIQFLKATGEQKENVRLLNEASSLLSSLTEQVNRTVSAMKNDDISAMDYMNECMSFIFFDPNRLKLVSAGDGKYRLLSRGRNVTPDHISVGERNVLALSYYFAGMFRNRAAESKYSDPVLLVIDDPISSFDADNRLGVLSLIRMSISEVLSGNADSKVLVLSHDMQSVLDLSTISYEIDRDNTISNYEDRFRPQILELANGELKAVGKYEKNQYKRLLISIFNYAVSPTQEAGLTIGNQMRRVLENYSSFTYNKGFKDMLMYEHDALNSFGSSKMKSFYKNYMMRILLDSESHMGNTAATMDECMESYSENDKRRTAIVVLLCLYRLNSSHLYNYLTLKDDTGKMSDNTMFMKVKQWAVNGLDSMIADNHDIGDVFRRAAQ